MTNQTSPIVLTGIKPTGLPHLGNYLGAIKPALALAQHHQARYFIADYHALNSVKNGEELHYFTLSIAASWLACGLDPQKVLFYRQSDIAETFELATMLMAFTAKGLLNRAHAYKAAVDHNEQQGQPSDHQINMGLYTYPVLMAADILLFDTQWVPVGRDQKQHIEMAQDMAQAVNHHYQKELFVIPQPSIQEDSQVILGLDGRKMSKSYNNTIPLFAETKTLKKLINSIQTNSQGIEEPKDPDSCTVFALYRLFATQSETEQLAQRYRQGGMGWGHAKTALFELIEQHIAPLREKYEHYMAQPQLIIDALAVGKQQAQQLAKQKMSLLRQAMGID
jgi:tryptophanyl-tRNA synthetase